VLGGRGGGGGGAAAAAFEDTFRAYSVAFSSREDSSKLQNGDKVILPSSALEVLTTMSVQYPMMFRVENPVTGMVTHVGVVEFTADEGRVLMPAWVSNPGKEGNGGGGRRRREERPASPRRRSPANPPPPSAAPPQVMEYLGVGDGGMVMVRNVRLPKATFVKLQPHSKTFLDLSNPKAV
jgi:ubiquitin fusion degradation protein 1